MTDIFDFLNRESARRVLLGLPRDIGSNNRIAVTYLISIVRHICGGNNCVEKKHCAQEKSCNRNTQSRQNIFTPGRTKICVYQREQRGDHVKNPVAYYIINISLLYNRKCWLDGYSSFSRMIFSLFTGSVLNGRCRQGAYETIPASYAIITA